MADTALATELTPDLLARVEALYDQGLVRQAYELGTVRVPLARWRGANACVLAGRIAANLGASRLQFRHHLRAYHTEPGRLWTRAYYLEVFLGARGPVFAWQKFRRFENEALSANGEPKAAEGGEYLFSLGARICGQMRDFEQAAARLKRAAEFNGETAWWLVEKSGFMAMKEQWEDSLELTGQALAIRPWYRPAVLVRANCLHTLNRDEEALQLLTEAADRLETLSVLNQLAALQMDLEKYGEAVATLERAERFSPIADAVQNNWVAAQKCRAYCVLGQAGPAASAARWLKDPYHQALADRLGGMVRPGRRVQLNIPFIQQFRMTCVPATLTMLRHFWKMEADHVELAEAICYDGTPSHRARQWAEAKGMVAREFTLNWEIAVALLDRGIPFAVFTTETTSAHIQVVAGYDELRRTLIIRNPAFPQIQEVDAERFLKNYAATGPAAMVLLPEPSASLISDLTFTDAAYFDRLRKVQAALEHHRRAEAEAELAAMQAEAPQHWLTLTAGRALFSYDTNLPALLACLEGLLGQFPEDGNLLFAKLGGLRETGRREDRLEYLRKICARPSADAVFHQQLAHELMSDARENPAAERALRRSLRLQPLNVFTLTSLANLYWSQRRFAEGLDTYRFTACLEDKNEHAAKAYFQAAIAGRQTETALTFLSQRAGRNLGKSPGPFVTWYHSLQQLGQSAEALKLLENTLRDHPEHGDLWLLAADARGRQSDFEKAADCLAQAEGKAPPGAILKAKADLYRYRSELKPALALWREVLKTEPLSLAAHRSLVWLLAESEGREAAIKCLAEVCERFPHHYQLHRLWCEWARKAGPEAAEKVVRRLIEAHPADAWARRELALVLADASRYEEALAEAEEGLRLAPNVPVSPTTRAHVRQGLGRTAEAQADYRAAIRLAVDYSPAIHGLVNSGATVTERREFLAVVEEELARQVVFGEGLRAYRDAARLNLEPAALLASLRTALRERPDLAVAWSALVLQLAEMLQLEEAESLGREATERFPLLEQAWLDLAQVQRLRLDVKGERAALEQAMRVSPTDGTAVRMLANHYERLGETAWAKSLFEDACARAPLDATSHGSLAVILWRQGQRPAAIERVRHAIKLKPDYVWGWQTLNGWAAATGQPKLAEELAKIMVLQRPGEIRSLLVLARILIGGKRLAEALQTVNQSLKKFPHHTEAHELRAEILFAMGKNEEANAACEPEEWGQRPPANLRACRARLEARRGNLVSAVERMKEVLRENPGDLGGWQNLADWHWQQKQPDDSLAAITSLERLDPLNPVPLGYRASLKLQREDRAGARADLEKALKLDPAYEFAAHNLFEIQITDADIAGAGKTLELIKRYSPAEKARACEVKLRTAFFQSSVRNKKHDKKEDRGRETAELEQAFAQLKELCLDKNCAPELVGEAIKTLLDAGQKKRVDQVLAAAVILPETNPVVGRWWMQRRIAQGKWSVTRQIALKCPQSETARNAVIVLIESLAATKLRRIDRSYRGWKLRWLAWRHRSWLPTHDNGWGAMGYALVTLRRNAAAIRWMRDWRTRPGVQMWMLNNLALALRVRRRWEAATEVLEFALNLPDRDHSFHRLRTMLAFELAVSGKTEAASALFRELNPAGFSGIQELQYHCVKGMLAVRQAEASARKKVYKTERAAIRQAMAKIHAGPSHSDSRRSLLRMAHDAGSKWDIVVTWLGC